MARIIPPDDELASPAEEKLRRACRIALSDERFVCVFGAPYIVQAANGRIDNGEIDVIIAHPERPLLLIEVKGGAVRVMDGSWYSTDRGGVRHRIKNPFDQVQNARGVVSRKVRSFLRQEVFVPCGVAVAFPDMRQGEVELPTYDSTLLVTGDDLPVIDAKIEALVRYWNASWSARHAAIGPDMYRAILAIFAPGTLKRSPVLDVRAEQARVDVEFSEAQRKVLGGFAGTTRLAVTGGAGTGKTVLALSAARRLAEEGLQVLLTCYNVRLAEYLRQVAGGVDGLTIATFHDVCALAAERAGTSPDRGRLGDSDYYEALPEALFHALVARPDLRYEAIVVDEAQDFTEDWGTLLTLMLTDTDNGVLYAFGDPAQDVSTQGKRWDPDFPARFQLLENFRNTRSIAEYAASFAPVSKLRSLGAGGLPVETVTLSSASDLTAELARLLERLVRKEAVPIESIAVLSAMGAKSSALHDGDRVGGFVLAHRPQGEGEVLFETARRFKGMEADVVILLEVEQARDVVRYVACTRARSHLIVLRIVEARASAA